MKKHYRILYIFLLFLIGCSNKERFPYTDQIVGYLHEVQNTDIKNETIIILVTGGCGTCDERTMKFVEEIEKKNEFKNVDKYIIFPNNHDELVEKYTNKGFKIIMDKNFKLRRYGLDLEKNLLVHFEDFETIKYWQWMYMDNFFQIGKEYKIVDL